METEIKEEGKFQYIEEGEGHPIIVLHGLFGALSNFRDVLDHFKGNYKVIIPLMPIYTLPVLSTNVASLAKFIHEFVEFKKLKNFSLLGNSLGGHVSLVFMKLYPELVHSIILTGSSGLYEKAMGDTFPRREDKNYIREKVAYTFYDPANATDELVDEVFGIINDKARLLRVLALAKSAIRHNMAEDLPFFDVPVCLIWGKNDNVTPSHVAEDFKAFLPRADLFWVDQCGHAPMMERPEEFNAILSKWLSENTPS